MFIIIAEKPGLQVLQQSYKWSWHGMGCCLDQQSYFLCLYWHTILKPHLAISMHFHFLLLSSLRFHLPHPSNISSQQIVEFVRLIQVIMTPNISQYYIRRCISDMHRPFLKLLFALSERWQIDVGGAQYLEILAGILTRNSHFSVQVIAVLQ